MLFYGAGAGGGGGGGGDGGDGGGGMGNVHKVTVVREIFLCAQEKKIP